MEGTDLKVKINIALITIIILGLTLFIMPVNILTYQRFIGYLKENGNSINDVSAQFKDCYETNLSTNYKVLDIDGEELFIEIGNNETIGPMMNKIMLSFTNPLADFFSKPHLYNRGYLVVIYYGQNGHLIKTIEEILGNSLLD
jgi:hypothetical protein